MKFRNLFGSVSFLVCVAAWASPQTWTARVAQATYDYRKASGALISESVDGFVKVGVQLATQADGKRGFAVAALVTDSGNAGGVYQVFRLSEPAVPVHLASLALHPSPTLTVGEGGVGRLVSVGYPRASLADAKDAVIAVSSVSLQSDAVTGSEDHTFAVNTKAGKKAWTAYEKTLPVAGKVVYCNFKKDHVIEPCAE